MSLWTTAYRHSADYNHQLTQSLKVVIKLHMNASTSFNLQAETLLMKKIKLKNTFLNAWLSSSVADPVHFFQIRIRIQGSGFKNTDPDPVFSRIWIRVTQKDRIQPDPDPQNCFLGHFRILTRIILLNIKITLSDKSY